jgi:hypothetical protein
LNGQLQLASETSLRAKSDTRVGIPSEFIHKDPGRNDMRLGFVSSSARDASLSKCRGARNPEPEKGVVGTPSLWNENVHAPPFKPEGFDALVWRETGHSTFAMGRQSIRASGFRKKLFT